MIIQKIFVFIFEDILLLTCIKNYNYYRQFVKSYLSLKSNTKYIAGRTPLRMTGSVKSKATLGISNFYPFNIMAVKCTHWNQPYMPLFTWEEKKEISANIK